MSEVGKHILIDFQRRWRLLLLLEVLLYSLGVFGLIWAVSRSLTYATISLVLIVLLLLLLRRPWQISLKRVSSFLDENQSNLEHSTGLVLQSGAQLSDLAQLQRDKIEKRLLADTAVLRPQVPLKKALLAFLMLSISALLLSYFGWLSKGVATKAPVPEEAIIFQPIDSIAATPQPPQIQEQKLTLTYPAYTQLSSRTTSNMNIKVLEGSYLHWRLQFDQPVAKVAIEQQDEVRPLASNGSAFVRGEKVSRSGIYNFKFEDTQANTYLSDLYAIEVVKDAAPEIAIEQLAQFTSFDVTESKVLQFKALVTDDYGVADTYIIATVSKGEGESVKFREERLPFANAAKGAKKLNLTKTIDLNALQMEAGDELYFYIEAVDVKVPAPNRTRSETYFAVIRDTVTNRFGVEGTMGADLMPDYFRSQRQLIIDTEKLIANKGTLSQKEFNFTSNELGYDQKSLRLKYGEFMGDEADSGLQVTDEVTVDEPGAVDSEESEEDLLDRFTHDHDSEGEHAADDHGHDHEENLDGEEKDDPLSRYLHDHDDPEEATLFTQSLKGKLRQAMAEMWDAELHLRLYTPENSLPFQYRALKLIQEIKNSARIYVHRIGFDPPPIKEDKRLSGEIDAVRTFQKSEALAQADAFEALRNAVGRIAELLTEKSALSEADRALFAEAGNELAVLAIENPIRYLETLQQLKWLSERKQSSPEKLAEIQARLWNALPPKEIQPKRDSRFHTPMNRLMLKELEGNE